MHAGKGLSKHHWHTRTPQKIYALFLLPRGVHSGRAWRLFAPSSQRAVVANFGRRVRELGRRVARGQGWLLGRCAAWAFRLEAGVRGLVACGDGATALLRRCIGVVEAL